MNLRQTIGTVRGPVLPRLIVLALMGLLSLISIALLLNTLVDKTRATEHARIRESFRTATLVEINLFETALAASILCNQPRCIKDWSENIESGFPWSSDAKLAPLHQLTETSDQTGSLEAQIKALTVQEQIQMYARPIYVQRPGERGEPELSVYLSDKNPQTIRTAKIDHRLLFQHISSQMAERGVFVIATLTPTGATLASPSEETDLEVDHLGLSVRLMLPKNSPASAETEIWIMLIATMSAILLVSIGLVFSETLRRRAAERNAREFEERAQMGAKLAALGEMASMLSHELNQPLAAIDTYASTALYRQINDPQLRQCIDQIKQQVQRAGMIIRSVHGFLKSKPTDVQSFNLIEMIGAIAPLVEIQAHKIGATINWLLPLEAWVTADQTMLEQVILNLARNGIESMRDSPEWNRLLTVSVSKKLGTRASADELRDNPMAAQPHVEIAVSDRGCGISPEMQKKIFMPFVSTKSDGVGVGLSFCRSVAEKHRGHIGFSPNPSGGTTFRFYLPELTVRELAEA